MDTSQTKRSKGLGLTIHEGRHATAVPYTRLHSPLPDGDVSCDACSTLGMQYVNSSNSLVSEASEAARSPTCDRVTIVATKGATNRAPDARIEAAGTAMPGEQKLVTETKSFSEPSRTQKAAKAAKARSKMSNGQKSTALRKGSEDCIRRICSEQVIVLGGDLGSAVPRSRRPVLPPAVPARTLAGLNRLLPIQARQFNSHLSEEGGSASASRAVRCVRKAHLEEASKEEIAIIEEALPVGTKLVGVKRVYNFRSTLRYSSRHRAALREAEDSEKMMWHHLTYGSAEAVSRSSDGVDAKRQLEGCYGYASLVTHTFSPPRSSPGRARAGKEEQAILVRAVLGRSKDLGTRVDIGTRGMRATPHRCYGSVHGTPGEVAGWEEDAVVYGVYDKASLCPAYVVTYQEQATWVDDEIAPTVKL